MDAFIVIIILASSILALYIGYLLGNFFPVFRSKKEGFKNRELLGDKFSKLLKPNDDKKRNQTKGRSLGSISLAERLKWIFLEIWYDADELTEKGLIKPDFKNIESENQFPESESEQSLEENEHEDGSEDPKTSERSIEFKSLDQKDSLSNIKSKLGNVNREDTLVIWYDRRSRKIIVETADKTFELGEDLDADQHGRLSMLILDLQDKVGFTREMKKKLRGEIEQIEQIEKDRPEETELSIPTFNPIKSFVNYIQADVPKIEEKGDSMPVQINKILQEQIKGTELEALGISVNDWPERGVVFNVGIDVYDEIELVPDLKIRKAIRNAVNTWDKQQGD